MSASREKKDRAGTGSTYAQRRNNQSSTTSPRKKLVYGVLGGVLAIAAIALLVWDTGFFQRRAVAVTIDGQDFPAATVQYYYNNYLKNEAGLSAYGASTFDSTKSAAEQVKDEESGQTWHDYFLEQAISSLTEITVLNHAAQEAGWTLDAAGQAYIQSQMDSLDVAWRVGGTYSNLEGYLRANFGSLMTKDVLEELVTMQVTAQNYQTYYQDQITFTDEELNAYYDEHKDNLDSFGYSVFAIQAKAEEQKDADGNTIEMTDEEKTAALEAAKTEAKALAEEIQGKLIAGEDVDALIESYGDRLYSSTSHAVTVGSSLSTSYSKWLQEAGRTAGDVSIQEYDGTTSYMYYVVQFDSRSLDDSATADIRHILVSAGSNPTEEDYSTAEAKAQALLDQWKAEDGTEEGFALLAVKNTSDGGSMATGGLYTGVSTTTGFIEPFTQWCLDPARQAGDTGLVKNEESSTKGWHIMYFCGWDDPTWKLTAADALREPMLTEWTDSLLEGVTPTQGSGIKYVA